MMQTVPFNMEADIDEDGIEAIRLVGSSNDPVITALMAELFRQAQPRGVWSDTRLHQWVADGHISYPDDTDAKVKVNPASVDLRLDGFYRRPRWYWRNGVTRWLTWHLMNPDKRDARNNEDFYWGPHEMIDDLHFWPGQTMLLSTFEHVHIPDDAVGVIYLKSTSARGYGFEHLHAGYVDPGWRGTLTLEATNPFAWPVVVGAFTHYVQLAILDLESPAADPYRGRYQDQQGATGPRKEVYHGTPRPLPPRLA